MENKNKSKNISESDLLQRLLNIDINKVILNKSGLDKKLKVTDKSKEKEAEEGIFPDAYEVVSLLRDEINKQNYYYYIKDNPIVSDAQYDRLMRNLEALEKKFPELITPGSPTQRIGAPLEGGFSTVEHGERMLSLQDAFSYQELKDFLTRVYRDLGKSENEVEFVCELKIDGSAVSWCMRTEDL